MVSVTLEAESDVTGTIAVVLMTSQGVYSECNKDNRCDFGGWK